MDMVTQCVYRNTDLDHEYVNDSKVMLEMFISQLYVLTCWNISWTVITICMNLSLHLL